MGARHEGHPTSSGSRSESCCIDKVRFGPVISTSALQWPAIAADRTTAGLDQHLDKHLMNGRFACTPTHTSVLLCKRLGRMGLTGVASYSQSSGRLLPQGDVSVRKDVCSCCGPRGYGDCVELGKPGARRSVSCARKVSDPCLAMCVRHRAGKMGECPLTDLPQLDRPWSSPPRGIRHFLDMGASKPSGNCASVGWRSSVGAPISWPTTGPFGRPWLLLVIGVANGGVDELERSGCSSTHDDPPRIELRGQSLLSKAVATEGRRAPRGADTRDAHRLSALG